MYITILFIFPFNQIKSTRPLSTKDYTKEVKDSVLQNKQMMTYIYVHDYLGCTNFRNPPLNFEKGLFTLIRIPFVYLKETIGSSTPIMPYIKFEHFNVFAKETSSKVKKFTIHSRSTEKGYIYWIFWSPKRR